MTPSFTYVLLLSLLGFSVGVFSGCFGIGGAWILTPSLNILGVPLPVAIGTDMAVVCCKSIIGVIKHSTMGHLIVRLSILITIVSILGMHLGAKHGITILAKNNASYWIRWGYICFSLLVVFLFLLNQFFPRKDNKSQISDSSSKKWKWFYKGFKYLSLTVIGYISGLLGIGGGLLRVPVIISLFRCTLANAIALDLVVLFFSSLDVTFQYFLTQSINYYLFACLMPSSALGVWFGGEMVKIFEEKKIKQLFIIFSLINLLILILSQMGYNQLSMIMIFILCTVGMLYFLTVLIKHKLIYKNTFRNVQSQQ